MIPYIHRLKDYQGIGLISIIQDLRGDLGSG
jgi:hypothetical protein